MDNWQYFGKKESDSQNIIMKIIVEGCASCVAL